VAHLRARNRGAGKRYFIRTQGGQELSAGRDLKTAKRILLHYRNLEEMHRHGVPFPTHSDWTLKHLEEWDRERRPAAWRRVRWSFLLDTLGADTRLDELTPLVLEAWTRKRLREVSPATVNRNRSFLRAAIRRARSASGFEDDPFAKLEPLTERREDRVILTPADVEAFLGACWRLAGTPRASATATESWQNAAMVAKEIPAARPCVGVASAFAGIPTCGAS
jgi:integrase